MYTLRQISKNQVFNQSLGDSYAYVDRFCNPEDFRHYFKSTFQKDHVADLDEESDDITKDVIGFIITHISIPIYKQLNYYVMTESGKTFEKINTLVLEH